MCRRMQRHCLAVKIRDATKLHPTVHRPGDGQIMTPFSFFECVSTSAVTAGEPLFDSWVTLTTCLTVPQSCSAEKNRKRNTNWKYMSLCSASSLCCCVRGWQSWGQDHEIQTYNTASCGLCFKFSQLQSIFSEDFVLALNSSQMHDNCYVFLIHLFSFCWLWKLGSLTQTGDVWHERKRGKRGG